MIALNLTVQDDKYDRILNVLKECGARENDTISFAEACREWRIPNSTLVEWAQVKKLIPFSQPVPNGKKYVKRSDLEKLMAGSMYSPGNKDKKRRKDII